MTEEESYYSILGVDRKASESSIRKAWKSLAQAHHPDKGGDEKEYNRLRKAYDTLISPTRRAIYDATLGSDFTPEEVEARTSAYAEAIITEALNRLVQYREDITLKEVIESVMQTKEQELDGQAAGTRRSKRMLESRLAKLTAAPASIIMKTLSRKLDEVTVQLRECDLNRVALKLFAQDLESLVDEREFYIPDYSSLMGTSWQSE